MNLANRLKQRIPEHYKSRLRPFLNLRLNLEVVRHWKDFEQVETYCMFIGYPRSGHSLVGQLINAHRNAIIAHEENALFRLLQGYYPKQIYALLLRRDEKFARRGRRWTGYSYEVPGLSQGQYKTLKVIGDKAGGMTTEVLAKHPELFEWLSMFGVPLRVIHHVRNPYDNISSISRREDKTLEAATQKYFLKATRARNHLKQVNKLPTASVLETHHEDLVAAPQKFLTRLMLFLGLDPYPEYLTACADVVFDSPHKSRHKVSWPPALKDAVAERMRQYDFLRGYSFH